MAAAMTGAPSISVITGLGYAFSDHNWLQASVQVLYKWGMLKNREVWFLNEDDRQVFLREKLVRKGKSFLLPGEGVDTNSFYPSPTSTDNHELVFLLIARIIRHKGIMEYIRAAEILQERGLAVRLQLLGIFDEGSPVAISRQQVSDWERRGLITYLGHADDVTPFISAADCIVLPSYREGMPLSLLEGASMCKALIATDVAGCRDLVRDGVNGYLCKKKDGTDLADKMEKYYALSPDARRQMGIEGRNGVLQHFTREIIAGIYLDKIREFLPDRQEQ
jgi:glycosyltransferase involved in cell wall biosynthesis